MADYLLVHIPGAIEPLERGNRFGDPLDRALLDYFVRRSKLM